MIGMRVVGKYGHGVGLDEHCAGRRADAVGTCGAALDIGGLRAGITPIQLGGAVGRAETTGRAGRRTVGGDALGLDTRYSHSPLGRFRCAL